MPGKLPQGKLPPRSPGDEDKIAKRTGQSSNSNGNGKTMSFYILLTHPIIAYSNSRHLAICVVNLTTAKTHAIYTDDNWTNNENNIIKEKKRT